MSSLAVQQGVPIPLDQIRSALESVAVPGYTGTLQVEVNLSADAASCVTFAVIRRQTRRADDAVTKQTLPDPGRKKPVEKVLADLRAVLFLRPAVQAVEAHYVDGVLQKFTLVS